METRVPIVNSEAKEEAFLHFLYKFLRTQELTNWIAGATIFSRFEYCLQGFYQDDRREILAATNSNEDCNANYFNSSQKLSQQHLCTRWKVLYGQLYPTMHNANFDDNQPTLMTTNQLYCWFWHLIERTKRLANAPPALFPIED
jgi:hypothetical protein